uniref:Uncharacterized protein n=1 Tax=Leviviridae sp. TaxID=2027243 RepID=A0A514D247_9VIRU|nr:MAG: hypothetical protein H1Bulk28FD59_000002 [Leviviridae sp.]
MLRPTVDRRVNSRSAPAAFLISFVFNVFDNMLIRTFVRLSTRLNLGCKPKLRYVVYLTRVFERLLRVTARATPRVISLLDNSLVRNEFVYGIPTSRR